MKYRQQTAFVENLNSEGCAAVSAVWGGLNSYVYVLRDPRDNKIFYVGKGGGEWGSDRPCAHFREAQNINNKSAKVNRIRDVWESQEPVEWFIVRHGLTTDQAFLVEAALIDALNISQNGQIYNLQMLSLIHISEPTRPY